MAPWDVMKVVSSQWYFHPHGTSRESQQILTDALRPGLFDELAARQGRPSALSSGSWLTRPTPRSSETTNSQAPGAVTCRSMRHRDICWVFLGRTQEKPRVERAVGRVR